MIARGSRLRRVAGFGSRDARGVPLAPAAKVLFVGVVGVALTLAIIAADRFDPAEQRWLAFAVLASCAAIAQLFSVRTGRNHSFHTGVLFIVAAALLLSPALIALMALLQHVPEWVKNRRYPAYIQAFNISNYVIGALGAWAAAASVLELPVGRDAGGALAGLAAAAVFVLLNHLVLACMLRLARGHSFRESELFSAKSLGVDFVLAGLGAALATLWVANPWLIPAVIAPLILSHRSLSSLALVREREELFRAMFESAAFGTCLVDADGQLVATNRALEELLGYTKSELAALPPHGATDVPDVETERALFAELFAGKRDDYRLEKRYVAKDGSIVWANDAVAVVRDADGKPQYAIQMVEDVTERRRTEIALRASEQRYRELFENATDGVATLDLARNFTSVNGALERILGFDADELLSMNLEDLLPEDAAVAVRRHAEIALRGRASHGSFEIEHVSKDGRRVPLELGTRVIYEDGRPTGFHAFVRDVSERRRLEDQLRHAQKMEAIGRLAGGVAHDFNNLLTAITGYSEFALRAIDERSVVPRKDISEIKKAAERATALTRQLLAFSRKQILQPEVIDVNDVVRDMEELLARLIGEDIQIVTEFTPVTACVKADPGQLEQVIANLVVNARDAMPDGGRLTITTAHVDVESHSVGDRPVAPGSYIALSVRDTGAGIDEATRARLFEPFFTTKEVGKGTGLGLATVYGIVKQSGGFITVDSEPGVGSVFTIYLHRFESAPTHERRNGHARTARNGAGTILLVEDEEIVRRLVREMLERSGYTTITARDGEEALALARVHEAIDLLLTDAVMPRLSGRELATQLVAARPSLKVLYMSGYTDDGRMSEHGSGPAVAFLQKPFTADTLTEKVRALLDAREASTR